jgi:hypothetical protein
MANRSPWIDLVTAEDTEGTQGSSPRSKQAGYEADIDAPHDDAERSRLRKKRVPSAAKVFRAHQDALLEPQHLGIEHEVLDKQLSCQANWETSVHLRGGADAEDTEDSRYVCLRISSGISKSM